MYIHKIPTFTNIYKERGRTHYKLYLYIFLGIKTCVCVCVCRHMGFPLEEFVKL